MGGSVFILLYSQDKLRKWVPGLLRYGVRRSWEGSYVYDIQISINILYLSKHLRRYLTKKLGLTICLMGNAEEVGHDHVRTKVGVLPNI